MIDIREVPIELQEKFAMEYYGIKVRKNTSDIYVVYQVLQNQAYNCVHTLHEVNTIIDAGANIGCASVFFAKCYPNAKIYALEPEKSNYKLLVKNTSKYPNVIPINAGLWGTDGVLNVIDDNSGNWGFKVSENGTGINKVKCYTINSLIKKFNIDEIDILKIDIEGGEKNVFEHPENIDFNKINIISIEIHDRSFRGCSTAFFKAISEHPEFKLDEVYTENLVLRKDPF